LINFINPKKIDLRNIYLIYILNKMDYSGSLHLIIGPMYSGKTTELLRLINRSFYAGKKCILVKHSIDTRYDKNYVTTHDNVKYHAFLCTDLKDLEDSTKFSSYEVICIDEIQFFKNSHKYCDKWANMGKTIIVAGLNGDFKREPFEIISYLIPLADKITHLTAICRYTGKDGVFSKRTTDEKEQIVIGGTDKYQATSREIYFTNLSPKKETVVI